MFAFGQLVTGHGITPGCSALVTHRAPGPTINPCFGAGDLSRRPRAVPRLGRAGDDVRGLRRQDYSPRMSDESDRSAIFHAAISQGEIFFVQVNDGITGRSA